MAAKLKNLKVTKVDFVGEGANQDAHIRLFKNREGASQETGMENRRGRSALKKLLAFIGREAGMGQEEIEGAVEEIQKENSMSFNEKISEANFRKISDEIWDVCYALQASLCSILYDEELDSGSAATAMQESLEEFCSVAKESIKQWSGKKGAGIVNKNEEMTAEDLKVMKAVRERLEKTIAKASSAAVEPENEEGAKGDGEEMKIDKSKLTAAEIAFLESIEKRCGMEDGNGQGDTEGTPGIGDAPPAVPPVQPEAGNPVAKAAGQQTGAEDLQPEADDIYKGLSPAVKTELEELKKFREASEEKELQSIAGKYAIIGKKAEELVPILKRLKAASGSAYSDYLAVMNEAVDIVEKSGAFSEIGKSGHGNFAGSAWAEADVKAVELMKSKTGLTKAQALDEVLMADPALAERCEKEG